jgi:predicted ribosome quality control (RQC) complex YloA/Tae2 family protein
LNKELQKWQSFFESVVQCQTKSALATLAIPNSVYQRSRQQQTQVVATKTTAPHRFFSASGYTILVGKNATQNMHLTFQIAQATDLWLHAHQVAGSHVIIKRKNQKADIDYETLTDAANLALYFSKARSQLKQEQEVIVTERRCVHRIKGAAPGKVSVSRYKTIRIALDLKRIEMIKARKCLP